MIGWVTLSNYFTCHMFSSVLTAVHHEFIVHSECAAPASRTPSLGSSPGPEIALSRGCIEALEVLQANALSPETNRNIHNPVGRDSRTLADPSANKVLMINMKYYHMLTFLRDLNNPREIDAPAGVKPVHWRLLTNRVADTLEQVGLVHGGGMARSI
jgi:hypothetical protein